MLANKMLSDCEYTAKVEEKKTKNENQTNLTDGQSLCDLIRCAVEQFMGITISSLLVYKRTHIHIHKRTHV